MHIDHYSFGNITIDGKSYSSDVIIFPDHVQSSWWRLEGHLLQSADLKDVIAVGVSILIVGTGYHGVMSVPAKTLEYLRSKGIKTYAEKTRNAVERYNKISSGETVIAALHLTC
jgi:hypothetical protein